MKLKAIEDLEASNSGGGHMVKFTSPSSAIAPSGVWDRFVGTEKGIFWYAYNRSVYLLYLQAIKIIKR